MACRKRLPKCRRELHRIANTVHVHVHRGGGRAQQVIMKRGDRQATVQESRKDRVHLQLRQYQIAHDLGLLPRISKREPGAKSKSWLEANTIQRHGKVGSREAVAMHLPGLHHGCSAHGRVYASQIGGRVSLAA
jgi:hypothetical protein